MSDVYPPAAFYFEVRFGAGWGAKDASFQEVGGVGSELTTEEYREGGENRFVHALPTGIKYPRLSLKRGVADKDSELVQWCKAVLEGGLSQPITTRDLAVVLLDESGDALRYWKFVNAFPAKWSVDPFQADKNAVAIEKVELVYAMSERRF